MIWYRLKYVLSGIAGGLAAVAGFVLFGGFVVYLNEVLLPSYGFGLTARMIIVSTSLFAILGGIVGLIVSYISEEEAKK